MSTKTRWCWASGGRGWSLLDLSFPKEGLSQSVGPHSKQQFLDGLLYAEPRKGKKGRREGRREAGKEGVEEGEIRKTGRVKMSIKPLQLGAPGWLRGLGDCLQLRS